MLLCFCVGPYLIGLAVTMFIIGVGTSPGGKPRVGKSNTMNAGVGSGRPLTSPAPGSVGRRSTISYDQAKTSSSSTERTNDVPRCDIQNYSITSTLKLRETDNPLSRLNQVPCLRIRILKSFDGFWTNLIIWEEELETFLSFVQRILFLWFFFPLLNRPKNFTQLQSLLIYLNIKFSGHSIRSNQSTQSFISIRRFNVVRQSICRTFVYRSRLQSN